jgi:hypothetical protein
MQSKNSTSQIFNSLMFLRECRHLQQKWISDNIIVHLIQTMCPIHIISNNMKNKLSTKNLNRSTNLNNFYFMKNLCEGNPYGLFKQLYHPQQSTKIVNYYFFCSVVSNSIPCSTKIYECNTFEELDALTSSTQHTRAMISSKTVPMISNNTNTTTVPIDTNNNEVVYESNLNKHHTIITKYLHVMIYPYITDATITSTFQTVGREHTICST